MKARPLVCVGIPTYDRPDGLKRTLDCIVGQTYENLEIIVSDNCSSNPEVQRVVRSFQKNDQRINYHIQPVNKGAAYNFQFVLQQATGEYFMWAADDDWWDTRFVEAAVAVLEADCNAVACWSDVLFHREDNALTWPEPYHLYNNPDLNSASKVTALLKYHFQYGWYGIFALFKRDAIAKVFPRHAGESNLVFGSDVHVITEVLLAGRVLKLQAPYFHYSTRKVSSADYHLARMPFGQGSKENPYLAQLLEILNIVMGSNALSAFEKISYYCRFLSTVLLNHTAWTFTIRRYPSGTFYRILLRAGKIRNFFMLMTIEVAIIGHKVFSKLVRGMHKVLRVAHHAVTLAKQLFEVVKFVASMQSRPRILIIEPNICHAEFAIGVASYLKQLGYNCQLLVSTEVEQENPFCRIPKDFAKIHYLNYPFIMRVIQSRLLSLYDLAIMSSSFDYRKMALFPEIYDFQHKPKSGMLFVEHGLQHVVAANPKLYQAYEAKRLLVLTNYRNDEILAEIGPCYFGDIKTSDKKNNTVVVLVPGSNSQDVSSLILSAKKLVDKGLKNFKLHVIGAPANESAKNDAEAMGVQDYVKLLGRVDFPTLYREIEESDFLVGPQDPSLYLNLKTSGSKLLTLGFLKPLIVPDELAAVWGFNASNCVNYSADQGLTGAIERALLMQDWEYRQLVDSLRNARPKVEKDSLQRLGKVLSELARV